jgi:glycosyltransferase involved in cell wall biosynthesis
VTAKPRIIAFITSYFPYIGGAEIALRQAARRLSHEFDFLIVTARRSPRNAAFERMEEGLVWRLGCGGLFDKWMLPLAAGAIRRRIVDEQIGKRKQLLWGLDISQASLAAARIRRMDPRQPFILTVQYGGTTQRLAHGRWGMIRRSFEFMLAQADHVTAISTPLVELVRMYGHRRKVSLIPNGVDLDLFQPARERVARSRPTVISVSRLEPKNGLDNLLQAIASLTARLPEVECRIVGSGSEHARLQELVSHLSLKERVQFLGDLSHQEVVRHLNESAVFVRPSRSEGMGNAFAEAMACGLPVIGTPVGGIVDLIDDGQTGLIAAVDHPQDLAEKICRVLTDQTLAKRLGVQGQAFVRERRDTDVIAERYAHLFREALAK